MSGQKSPHGYRLVLSPQEAIVGGGAAEAFESHLQQLFRGGYRDLVVDLSGVSALDSAGIRALVRGHTSAQRVAGTLRVAAPKPAVKKVLELSHLGGVLEMYDSLEAAKIASWPWRTIRLWFLIAALSIVLVTIGLRWPQQLAGIADTSGDVIPGVTGGGGGGGREVVHRIQPFIELLKLIAAGAIGLLVTAIHQPSPRDRPMAKSMEQAQTLLCVAGAMIMILISGSVARAFGIAGAASIMRFRTPVDDPKDVIILFLLMTLGMATGLGGFAVAGLGTAFLSSSLMVLDRWTAQATRLMSVEVMANGRQFPSAHVESVFVRNNILFEPREITQSDDVMVKYLTWIDERASLDDLSKQLMAEDAGIAAVSWEHAKRA